jgi:hypothetical protein
MQDDIEQDDLSAARPIVWIVFIAIIVAVFFMARFVGRLLYSEGII